jgi:hypothetical protein
MNLVHLRGVYPDRCGSPLSRVFPSLAGRRGYRYNIRMALLVAIFLS